MESEKQTEEIQKLADIASDLSHMVDLRTKAIELLGNTGTHEALLALLGLAGNDNLPVEERDLALKRARDIIKTGR